MTEVVLRQARSATLKPYFRMSLWRYWNDYGTCYSRSWNPLQVRSSTLVRPTNSAVTIGARSSNFRGILCCAFSEEGTLDGTMTEAMERPAIPRIASFFDRASHHGSNIAYSTGFHPSDLCQLVQLEV